MKTYSLIALTAVVLVSPACKSTRPTRPAETTRLSEFHGPVRIIGLNEVPSLPPGILQANGSSLRIREPFFFDTESKIGFFELEVFAGRRIASRTLYLNGDVNTLNELVREVDYANNWSMTSLPLQVPKGIWDSLEDTVEGVVDLVRHPIRAAVELGDTSWELVKYSWQVAKLNANPIEDIAQLARATITNACIEVAEEKGLQYLLLQTDEARDAIEREAYARLVGQLVVLQNQEGNNTGMDTCDERSESILGGDQFPALLEVKKGPPLTGLILKVAKELPKFSKLKRGASNAAHAMISIYPKLQTAHRLKAAAANRVIKSIPALERQVNTMRQTAIATAWKKEYESVRKGRAGSRAWTEAEKRQLLKNGRVPGYDGHHINSVSYLPELAGAWKNVQFLTEAEHLAKHGGNFRNWTHGPLINRPIPF